MRAAPAADRSQQQVIVLGTAGLQHAALDLHQVIAGGIVVDQCKRVRALCGQAARGQVRGIAQCLHALAHPHAGGIAHVRLVVEHPRHGLDRHAGGGGDIFDSAAHGGSLDDVHACAGTPHHGALAADGAMRARHWHVHAVPPGPKRPRAPQQKAPQCGAFASYNDAARISASSNRRTRRWTWCSSSCPAGTPSRPFHPSDAAACAGSRSSAAVPARSAGLRGGYRSG